MNTFIHLELFDTVGCDSRSDLYKKVQRQQSANFTFVDLAKPQQLWKDAS